MSLTVSRAIIVRFRPLKVPSRAGGRHGELLVESILPVAARAAGRSGFLIGRRVCGARAPPRRATPWADRRRRAARRPLSSLFRRKIFVAEPVAAVCGTCSGRCPIAYRRVLLAPAPAVIPARPREPAGYSPGDPPSGSRRSPRPRCRPARREAGSCRRNRGLDGLRRALPERGRIRFGRRDRPQAEGEVVGPGAGRSRQRRPQAQGAGMPALQLGPRDVDAALVGLRPLERRGIARGGDRSLRGARLRAGRRSCG